MGAKRSARVPARDGRKGMAEEFFKDDELAVAVKAEAAEEIKRAYGMFGWRLSKECADGSYHAIAGKDRLQLLQVRYEVALNFMSRARRRAFARAVVLAVLLSLAGLALVVFGAVQTAAAQSSVFLWGGVALIVGGAAFFVVAACLCRLLYRRDSERYGAISAVLRENAGTILKEAADITGVRRED